MSDVTSTASPSGSGPTQGGEGGDVAYSPRLDVDAADDDDDENHDKPARKKPKRNQNRSALSRVRGRKGALKAFMSLPLDVVLDICTYLEPADLYALSNTSKIFRSVVTGPASAQLWVDARAKVGLPELQHPMSDLQYATLLFGRYGCQFCGRKNAGKPEVYFRVRVCTACLNTHFASPKTSKGLREIDDILPRPHHLTLRLARETDPNAREGGRVHLASLAKLDADLHDAFPEANWLDCDYADTLAEPRYSWREAGDPATPVQKWIKETWMPAREARLADGLALMIWLHNHEESKAKSRAEVREQRRADFEARFAAQGFGPADFNYEWRDDPLVKKPEPLTDRIWARAEPILREKLYGIRKQARIREMTHSYGLERGRRRILVSVNFMPGTAATLPTFTRLVADNSTSASGTQLFDDNIDAILDEAVAVVKSRLQAMVRLVAAAHAEIRQGQSQAVEGDEATSDPFDAMEGLAYDSVKLPRLPSWIPRTCDTSISATPEQMYAFLESHPLAFFECRKCGRGLPGAKLIAHVQYRWSCGPPYPDPAFAGIEVATWLPVGEMAIGETTVGGVSLNAKGLLRMLKLSELAESVELVPADSSLETKAADYGIIMPEAEKFMVKFHCRCACGPKTLDLHGAYHHLSQHWIKTRSHAVTVEPVVEYSYAFKNKVHTASMRDAYGYFGLGSSMNYDRDDDDDDDDEMDDYYGGLFDDLWY